jgi:hypothetical protein
LEPQLSDQISFFLNVAVIGATLFGLTLVALVGFLPLHVERFRQTGLAAFPHSRKFSYERGRYKLFALSDREIIDGDPLVFFTAYSMGTSWSFFTLPIALGLTMAWPVRHIFLCGVEIVILTTLLGWALWGRNQSLRKLSIYLTNEERSWPVLSGIVLFLLYVAALDVFLTDILLVRYRWIAIDTLKVICIGSLMLGTYVLNKEVFVYFKANAVERLRTAWLQDFLRDFPELSQRVQARLADSSIDAKHRSALASCWNEGVPTLRSAHDEFRAGEDLESLELMWSSMLRDGAGAYAWAVDVPEIASWDNKLEILLER